MSVQIVTRGFTIFKYFEYDMNHLQLDAASSELLVYIITKRTCLQKCSMALNLLGLELI